MVKNSGPTSWPAEAALVHMDGPQMCPQKEFKMGGRPPAATHQLQIVLTAPMNAGQYASVMQSISRDLSDEEIDALANYMHGLYK